MVIKNNSVVRFHYSLVATPSNIEESTFDNNAEPILYMHGKNNIVRGLEKAMEGKAAGDKFEVTVEAIEGYGLRDDSRVQRVPAKYLKHEKKLRKGQQVQINTENGPQWVTVIKVGKFSVDVDANHPLAGQTLAFNIEIIDVREPTQEELDHGHAHGPDGHHHDH